MNFTETEKNVQAALLEYLRWKKIPCTVTNAEKIVVGVRCPQCQFKFEAIRRPKVSVEGWPDLTACLKGRFWGIEVKTQKGITSPAQRAVHKCLEGQGGLITIARSIDDLETVCL